MPKGAADMNSLLLPLLSSVEETDTEGRQQGFFDNMRVIVDPYSVTISGSLARWYFGDNISTHNRQTTQAAIKELSKRLSLPLEKAEVKRIDFSANIVMRYKSSVYLNRLGDLSRYEQVKTQNGIEYRQNRREYALYDKIKEIKSKRKQPPANYRNIHIIRVEMRYKYDLTKILNSGTIKARDLYNKRFYSQMISRWKETYYQITKTLNENDQRSMEGATTNTNSLLQYLARIGLRQSGEEQRLLAKIREDQQTGKINNMMAKRLRDTIQKIKTSSAESQKDEILTELNNAIDNAAVINGPGGMNKKRRCNK